MASTHDLSLLQRTRFNASALLGSSWMAAANDTNDSPRNAIVEVRRFEEEDSSLHGTAAERGTRRSHSRSVYTNNHLRVASYRATRNDRGQFFM
jgi:hypothetical protein